MTKTTGFRIYEDVAMGISNVRSVCKIPITPEMWESICERARVAGMEPNAYLDSVIEEFNRGDHEQATEER